MNNSFEKYNPRNEHIYTTFKVIDTWTFNLCPPVLHFLVRSKSKSKLATYLPLTEK